MTDIEVSEGARGAATQALHHAATRCKENCPGVDECCYASAVDPDAALAAISAYHQHLQQHPEEASELWEKLGMPGMVRVVKNAYGDVYDEELVEIAGLDDEGALPVPLDLDTPLYAFRRNPEQEAERGR